MTYFLTSNPCLPGSTSLNPANGFVEELKKALPGPRSALFIASDPYKSEDTDRFMKDMRSSFAEIGIPFEWVEALTWENEGWVDGLVPTADLIFLCGGNVPAQNRFFQRISLRECLAGRDSVVVGVGTGSMNAAEAVSVLSGELKDPEDLDEDDDDDDEEEYLCWLPGLGLTQHMLLPNYQKETRSWLNGMHSYDHAYGEFYMNEFYALVDGSYILGRDGREELHGEAYLLKDASIRQISRENDCIVL